MPRTIFSASEAYFPAARQELLAAFPGAVVEPLGPDAGRFEHPEVDIVGLARACRERPIVFVRHLARELASIPPAEVTGDVEPLAMTAARLLADQRAGPEIALQLWISGSAPGDIRSDELWRQLADRLRAERFDVARGNREEILSVVITAREVLLGLNRRAEALTDWPGGRVGLARSKEQISRSEFKLEELFKTVDLPLPATGRALDLGASPGGWTRILRRRGFSVWAVDPAELDPRLAGDPEVHHIKTTARPFLHATGTGPSFDLIVNDMRMAAEPSVALMLRAVDRLRSRGLVIMTVKLPQHGREPLTTVNRSLQQLRRVYQIIFARQLFHNRNEITVVARGPRGSGNADLGSVRAPVGRRHV